METAVRGTHYPREITRRLTCSRRGLKAVLHDRPPAHFHSATAFETHEVIKTLLKVISPLTFGSVALPSHFPLPASCLPAGVQSTGVHTSYSSHVIRTPKSAA
jgi:hypothetical protein